MKMAKHQNVYADTSGSASNKNNVIEYAVSQLGSERILFGTDSYSCAFQRGRIDYADITEEAKENILNKNALRLFPNLELR
jgi:predicted TIM-barrel fold metal-dependent hydrolase